MRNSVPDVNLDSVGRSVRRSCARGQSLAVKSRNGGDRLWTQIVTGNFHCGGLSRFAYETGEHATPRIIGTAEMTNFIQLASCWWIAFLKRSIGEWQLTEYSVRN